MAIYKNVVSKHDKVIIHPIETLTSHFRLSITNVNKLKLKGTLRKVHDPMKYLDNKAAIIYA